MLRPAEEKVKANVPPVSDNGYTSDLMTIIGVDVGTVRVGVATADPTVRIPFPVAIWPRAQYEAEKNILKLIEERKGSLLVVGLPLDEDGNRTDICENIEAFVRRLAKRTPIKIVYIDEEFSSVEASEKLSQAASTAHRVDAAAACLILQRYFDLTP
jgi:putative Holliday junction resolvase